MKNSLIPKVMISKLINIFPGFAEHNVPFAYSQGRTAAIQERVTAVLRSIPKEAFADSFQKLYERCQQCVVNDGDYFEGQ
jgi:hypothetical protein